MSTLTKQTLSHLDWLEAEAIHILREVAGQCANPVLLFSGGKDSICLLRLAEKAFRPGRFPFPLMHIDTGHNYKEVTDFRDKRAAELGERLIVRSVEDSMARGTVVLKHAGESRNKHQSVTLLEAIEEFGFDACIDYRQHPDLKSLSAALKQACPQGIDGVFENVGGLILDAVLLRANAFSRVALCGMIAGYNGEPIPLAAPQLILVNRMKVQGFIVSEHMQHWPQALRELGGAVASGQLKYRESVAQGIEAAPEAFIGLLKGKNFGKQLVKLN